MSEVRNGREDFRELFEELKARGLTEYGSIIDGNIIRAFLGIVHPDVAPKSVYDKLALAELGAIDYVRNILLGQGKYVTSTPSGYRILLPSENAKQVDLYISSADRKLNRALKLSRNTPKEPGQQPDQTEARIMMKQTRRKF
jgi:hypothetical protein